MLTCLLRFCFFITFFLSTHTLIFACTGLQLKAEDGSFINGRTVEFGVPLDLAGLVVPRNHDFYGTLPDGKKGLHYRSKYAVLGSSAFNEPAIVDGLNEKGLSGGVFYFPGYATYATITSENQSHALAPTEFLHWVLTQFANVEEAKQAIPHVAIAPTNIKAWGGVPPFHYIIYDQSGKSIVVEPIDGKLVVAESSIGVITNSPDYVWHVQNLSNYINLSPLNAPSKSIDGVALQQFGQGSGLHGLPGDFTPPSRFIRAAIFATTAVPANNANDTVFAMFHLLNQFDIPKGSVRADNEGKMIAEYTLATTVKDLKNLKYYFKTYENQNIKVIDLKSFDWDNKAMMTLEYKSTQPVNDISETASLRRAGAAIQKTSWIATAKR